MNVHRGSAAPRLLALVPKGEAAAIRQAALEAGARAEVLHTLSAGVRRAREGWDAVLLSLSLEHADLATAAVMAEQPEIGAFLLAVDRATLERMVEGRRAGAAAVLAEPLEAAALSAELLRIFRRAGGVTLPELPAKDGGDRESGGMLGSSPAVARVFDVIARVADTPATVLVTGESGTGKELVARSLHEASGRRAGAFVPVNCAAIPEHLLESELFGHERGAFTGAIARKEGRFLRAHGGTLFLDEVGDMSLVLQAKILRVLEEREVERVGGTEAVPVDVRIVAATSRSLAERIEQGEFREDLYYRLAVIRTELPPLRERGEDVQLLALHFAASFVRAYGRPVHAISREALRQLRDYPWPGNVRELRNVMDRAVLLCRGRTLGPEDLLLGDASPRGSPKGADEPSGYPPSFSLARVEANHIGKVLTHTGGHLGEAARVLGIHRNTLTRKVREYGLGDHG